MTSQSTIPIDHIAERLSTAHLWIECAESDIQRGNLRMVKIRINRIRELLDQAEQSTDEELAMPNPPQEVKYATA